MTAASYKMTDSFDLLGKFWMPEQPERIMLGRLQCSRDGMNLSLEDPDARERPVAEALKAWFETPEQRPCILGKTSDGLPCSLFKVLPSGHVHFVLIGMHAKAIDEVRALRAYTKCSHLLSFVWRTFFEIEQEWLEDKKHSVNITYSPASKIDVRIEHEKSAICFRGSAGWTASRERHVFCASESLDIIPDEPQTLEWFVRTLHRICNLLSLLTDEIVAPVQFRFTIDGKDSDNSLLYQPIRPASGDEDRVAVMFSLEQVQGRLENILDKWFSADATLCEAIGLFLDARFARGLSLYTQFPMLAQSVEAFSRATCAAEYLTKEAYEPIRQALVAAIPKSVGPDHREALKSRLRYLNEFSLRKRVETLFSTLQQPTAALVCDDRDVFIEEVVNMRHYLSHRTDELRESALEGISFYWTCEQLMILLRLLLLKHLGIDEEVVVERVKNGNRTSQVIDNMKKRAEAAAGPSSDASPKPSVDSSKPKPEP
jgi:hypothetical protein